MSNIAKAQPSLTLDQLKKQSKLSNTVSKQALNEAIELWQDYVLTANKRRDFEQINSVANKLELIIKQVSNGCTRINPTMWLPLIRLENNLRDAASLRVHLELNAKAANDYHTDSEVA